MCNRSNPAGNILHSKMYLRAIILCSLVGIIVTLKRFWLAAHFARRLYSRYNGSVEVMMDHLVLVTEVTALTLVPDSLHRTLSADTGGTVDQQKMDTSSPPMSPHPEFPSIKIESSSHMDGILSQLDEWEEPAVLKKSDYVSTHFKLILFPFWFPLCCLTLFALARRKIFRSGQF